MADKYWVISLQEYYTDEKSVSVDCTEYTIFARRQDAEECAQRWQDEMEEVADECGEEVGCFKYEPREVDTTEPVEIWGYDPREAGYECEVYLGPHHIDGQDELPLEV